MSLISLKGTFLYFSHILASVGSIKEVLKKILILCNVLFLVEGFEEKSRYLRRVAELFLLFD